MPTLVSALFIKICYGEFMKKLVLYIFIGLVILTNPSWSSACNGYNSETNAWVWGTCDDGVFNGYDSETNSWVWGTCDQDMFNAYDSETNAWVWGSCDL